MHSQDGADAAAETAKEQEVTTAAQAAKSRIQLMGGMCIQNEGRGDCWWFALLGSKSTVRGARALRRRVVDYMLANISRYVDILNPADVIKHGGPRKLISHWRPDGICSDNALIFGTADCLDRSLRLFLDSSTTPLRVDPHSSTDAGRSCDQSTDIRYAAFDKIVLHRGRRWWPRKCGW